MSSIRFLLSTRVLLRLIWSNMMSHCRGMRPFLIDLYSAISQSFKWLITFSASLIDFSPFQNNGFEVVVSIKVINASIVNFSIRLINIFWANIILLSCNKSLDDKNIPFWAHRTSCRFLSVVEDTALLNYWLLCSNLDGC